MTRCMTSGATELRAEIKAVMARRRPDHPHRISTTVAMDLVAELEAEIAEPHV